MPLTVHQWTRTDNEDPSASGWPSNAFTSIATLNSPPDGEVWKDLVRVELSVVATVWAASGLFGPGWAYGGITAMAGIKFAAGGTPPTMDRSDVSPDVLGIYHLIPTVAGSAGGSAPYTVTWAAQQPISVRTSRKISPAASAVVGAYMWLDIADVGFPNFSWQAHMAALWAR